MKPKHILCLALVLSGGLFGCRTTSKSWDDNTSVRKVKFTEAELVGTYRMPIFSDRYVWLGPDGDFFTHFNENYDAWGSWSLAEGVLILVELAPSKTNTPAGEAFFRPLKTRGPGVEFCDGLKFERHSIALQWMQRFTPEVPKKLGSLDSLSWFLRDSHTNEIFINNCGTNSLQNQNPTEAEIHAAIFALDTKRGKSDFSIGPTPMIWIHATGDQKIGFELEYQDCKPTKEKFQEYHNYQAKRKFTADEVVKVLVSYLNGSNDWKKAAHWKQTDISIQ
jgi:hypothetical protein